MAFSSVCRPRVGARLSRSVVGRVARNSPFDAFVYGVSRIPIAEEYRYRKGFSKGETPFFSFFGMSVRVSSGCHPRRLFGLKEAISNRCFPESLETASEGVIPSALESGTGRRGRICFFLYETGKKPHIPGNTGCDASHFCKNTVR